jgi:nuclear GTP-binding protein
VGLIGYPNVGKSSVINTLKSKKVCKVAPIAGETKVWQYITLMRRIYLIDCPGVVYPSEETDVEKVLKGVVRVENVENPADYVASVLEKVKPEHIVKTYGIQEWKDYEDFLTKMAKKSGRLLKGGEPDLNAVAKMVLNDWQRGKIPYFTIPAGYEAAVKEEDNTIPGSGVNDEESIVDEAEEKPGKKSVREILKEKLGEEDEEEDSEEEADNDSTVAGSVASSSKKPKLDSTDEEMETSVKKGRQGRQRDGPKLTSKARRKQERENKRKKIGSNFYEVTNVKNRNRERKVPKSKVGKDATQAKAKVSPKNKATMNKIFPGGNKLKHLNLKK